MSMFGFNDPYHFFQIFSVSRNRVVRHALDHSESSGTNTMMSRPIVCQLCELESRETDREILEDEF